MKEPIRVLQVLGTTGLGGAESRVMDLYRNIDRERVQFDFAVHTSKKGYFDEEIEALGGHIYRLPRFRVYNWIPYRAAWRSFFKEHSEYACVHGHMTSTASIYLPEAKRGKIALTAAHARSAGTEGGVKGMMTKRMRKNLWKKTDVCLACSKLAGKAVFGEKAWAQGVVHVVPNAIEVDKFSYNDQMRAQMRQKLELGNCLTVGHVGRFNEMKNHLFLLEVFAQIKKSRPDAQLILLGEGGGMEPAKQKAAELGIAESVQFLGNQGNPQDYYQAMDLFIFPSLYEGLPGTVLEAQAAGLPCLMSDTITQEVALTELVESKSLKDSAESWAQAALALLERQKERFDRMPEIRKAGFDAKEQAKEMEAFYRTGKGDGLWNR